MRLRPLQIVGLIALVVFGTIFLMNLLEPERDPFAVPGAMPLGSDTGVPLSDAGAAAIADPLSVGSADSKDDLYCSGLLFAAQRDAGDIATAEAQSQRDRVIALAEAGVAKLIAEGAADESQTAAIADAHSVLALSDFVAGTPRISVVECEVRGTRLTQQPSLSGP